MACQNNELGPWRVLRLPASSSNLSTADGNRQSPTIGIARLTRNRTRRGSRAELEFRLSHRAASLREGERQSSLVPCGDRDRADAQFPGSCRCRRRPACSSAVASPRRSARLPSLRPRRAVAPRGCPRAEAGTRRGSSRCARTAPALFTALFFARVAGQALVALAGVTWLPPMSAWYSGLLPYPVLLPVQILILGAQLTIDWQVWRDTGFFARPRPRVGRTLRGFNARRAAAPRDLAQRVSGGRTPRAAGR